MDLVTNYIASHSSGRKNPVYGRNIASALGVSGVEVRRLINMARCSGNPICSCSRGYYIAESREEIEKTIDSLRGRVAVMNMAADGLQRTLEVRQ